MSQLEINVETKVGFSKHNSFSFQIFVEQETNDSRHTP